MGISNPRLLHTLYSTQIKPLQMMSAQELNERYAAMQAMAVRLRLSPEEAEVLDRYGIAEEVVPRDAGVRTALVQYLQRRDFERPSVWQVVTGMHKGYENPRDRRERVRALWKSTVLLIRRELKWDEEERAAGTNAGERSVFWDPAAEVSRWQEISQSKLSSFCKELTGSNLGQTIDNVKAEKLEGKLRKQVREFVHGFRLKVQGSTLGEGEAEALTPRAIRPPVGPLPEGEGAHGATCG